MFFDALGIFADPRHTIEDLRVVLRVHVEGLDARIGEAVEAAQQVFGEEGDVLYARALVFAQVLVDLRLLFVALVDGDAEGAAGRAQREAGEARLGA